MNFFIYDERLGINLPDLDQDWDDYSIEQQRAIVFQWERIRGSIPTRIFEIEQVINVKQACLNTEENFLLSCRLNSEIAELASVINDLQIWYRVGQDVTPNRQHG
ncbi:MAG: hypothetical protein RLZZ267_1159 [Bacillota bacterium]|jgi:hypothetical protein